MKALEDVLLPGVPATFVRDEILSAAGNEVGSGKIYSPNSSAALAVNTFGWFLERPSDLPPLPNLESRDRPALRINLEREMRFPWEGDGGHPCLDAAIETPEVLIGVESKRFEPFRDSKKFEFSNAYDLDVWGAHMAPFERIRDVLKRGEVVFRHLDAAQLVKHAFGLVTEGRRLTKQPVLYYLFAEPKSYNGKSISEENIQRHRQEVALFEKLVAGAEVTFAFSNYRDWLSTWTAEPAEHAAKLIAKYDP